MQILEHGGRWHVEFVSPDGFKASKSFASLGRARAWVSRYADAAARYLKPVEEPDPATATLYDLLERYAREVSSAKKGAKAEGYRIGFLQRSRIAALPIASVTSHVLAEYRNERLAVVANSTVRNEMSILRRTIETARREWGYALPNNAAALVTLPSLGPSRDRRLRTGEYDALARELEGHPLVWAFVQLAIETAMRRGELLALEWRDVFLDRGVLHVAQAKNGHPRHVPLTDHAIAVLLGLQRHSGRVFPIDLHALRWAWCRACDLAGIKDLRVHDLRHEGVSRLFERGLSVPEVAAVSGHRTPAMLMKYVHPDALTIRRKLHGKEWGDKPDSPVP